MYRSRKSVFVKAYQLGRGKLPQWLRRELEKSNHSIGSLESNCAITDGQGQVLAVNGDWAICDSDLTISYLDDESFRKQYENEGKSMPSVFQIADFPNSQLGPLYTQEELNQKDQINLSYCLLGFCITKEEALNIVKELQLYIQNCEDRGSINRPKS